MSLLCDHVAKKPRIESMLKDPLWNVLIREQIQQSPFPPIRLSLQGQCPFDFRCHSYISVSQAQANKQLEDAHFLIRDIHSSCLIVGVLDGHGGTLCVQTMREWIPRLIQPKLRFLHERNQLNKDTAALAVRGAIEEAEARWTDALVTIAQQTETIVDQEDRAMKRDKIEKAAFQGTCALVAVIGSNFVSLANVGDCRALVINLPFDESQAPTAEWMNKVHTPYYKEEYDMTLEINRNKDKMPVRPSIFEVGSHSNSLVMQQCIFRQNDLIRSMLETVSFESYEDAARSLANSVDAPHIDASRLTRRMAGNLTVTRALGDTYLKVPLLAPLEWRDKVPYVHALPSISTFEQVEHCRSILVMATDGIWDLVDRDSLMETLIQMERDLHNGMPFSMAQTIIQDCISSAAEASSMEFEALMKMEPGKEKRQVHDDMTIFIAWLGHAPYMVHSFAGSWKTRLVDLP